MSKTVTIEKSTIIRAPIETVWRISADEFEHIDRWDANIKSSRSRGVPTGSAHVGGRVCDQYGGRETVEDLIEYDPHQFTFVYAITEGLPGFVVSAQNRWTHEPVTSGKTKLTMRVDMKVKGLLGALMQGPMKSQMGKLLSRAQEELAHYVETGQPHPRKKKKQNQ